MIEATNGAGIYLAAPVSPRLVPFRPKIKPELSSWGSEDETDLEDLLDTHVPWNPAFRERKRSHIQDDDKRPRQYKKSSRDAASWKDGILVHEMGPRYGWIVATEAALTPLPFIDLDAQNALKTLNAPKSLGSRKRRKRFGLPLLVARPVEVFISTRVTACPDSGSDENIISLELAKNLGLDVVQPSPDEARQFSTANGKIVMAVGQVSVRCRFARGTPSTTPDFDCIFHVFTTLAVPLIMGLGFLQETETMSKYRDRLIEELVPATQALRVNSVGRPKRSLVCRLGTYVGCATVDSGSDLDLVSSEFAKSRAYKIEPGFEQVQFADCSVGYTSGVITTSFAAGNVSSVGFQPRGESIDLDLFVLESLNADILVGQDTIETLDIFNLHNESLVPSIPRLGESDVNIIRHIGSLEQAAKSIWNKVKSKFSDKPPDCGTSLYDDWTDLDQRENARRERERARITSLLGSAQQRAQELEEIAIQAYETQKEKRLRPPPELHNQREYLGTGNKNGKAGNPQSTDSLASTYSPPSPIYSGSSKDRITSATDSSYICTFDGCTAAPFSTQYLLNCHSNVHLGIRLHYCPVPGCSRGEGGKGFKRKNEMIRHGLVHDSPGYICPFCPDRDHRYPRPYNLQQHVRAHHADRNKDDLLLHKVLMSGARSQPKPVSHHTEKPPLGLGKK